MVDSEEKRVAFVLLTLGMLLGPGTIVVFLVFLFSGPIALIQLQLADGWVIVLDIFLSFLFILPHSSLIRKSVRNLVTRWLPEYYYGVSYAIISGLTLLGVLLFWQESSVTIFSAQGTLRLLFHGLYIICIVGFLWCMVALGSLDPFGLQAVLNHIRGTKDSPQTFTLRGPYRWVRHPVYFIWLIIFWAYPDLTLDRVVLNLIWSGWIIIATQLEEKDMQRCFGQEWADYRNKVPMLIPGLFRSNR